MQRSRVVPPDTVRVEISGGDYLVLKKRLTAGETRRFLEAVRPAGVPLAELKSGATDPDKAGRAWIVAYLVDWNLLDLGGNVISIRGAGELEINAALDSFPMEDVDEILGVVMKHHSAMQAEQDEQKKTRPMELVS